MQHLKSCVTLVQAEMKLNMLRVARDAFAFRPYSSESPSATDFILSDVCARAERNFHGMKEAENSNPNERFVPFDYRRCLVAPT